MRSRFRDNCNRAALNLDNRAGGTHLAGVTNRDFRSGADRGNKLSPDRPRGFRGGKHGRAGKCIRVDPKTVTIDPPGPASGTALKYARYAINARAQGRVPMMPKQWASYRPN